MGRKEKKISTPSYFFPTSSSSKEKAGLYHHHQHVPALSACRAPTLPRHDRLALHAAHAFLLPLCAAHCTQSFWQLPSLTTMSKLLPLTQKHFSPTCHHAHLAAGMYLMTHSTCMACLLSQTCPPPPACSFFLFKRLAGRQPEGGRKEEEGAGMARHAWLQASPICYASGGGGWGGWEECHVPTITHTHPCLITGAQVWYGGQTCLYVLA